MLSVPKANPCIWSGELDNEIMSRQSRTRCARLWVALGTTSVVAVLLGHSAAASQANVADAQFFFDASAGVRTDGAEVFRLRINRTSVAPDGTLQIRVENRGSQPLIFGDPFSLEHRDHGDWRRLPVDRHFFAPRHSVPPGRVGEAQDVHVPRWAPSGVYRVSKQVKPAATEGHWRPIRALFEVR